MIMVMNGMRKKRHRIVYEEMDIVSKNEADQAVRWTEEFVNMITDLIHHKIPQPKKNI
jgi:V8-like Glu-specific endopeptidase